MLAVFPKVGVVVVTLFVLTAENAPMVEPLRLADEMPFTDHGSLITGLLKEFGECLLVTVKCACIVGETVLVAEFAGEDTGSRRS